MIKRLFIILALWGGISSLSRAQDIPEPMQPRRIVNDFTGLFSKQQQTALEQKLKNFNDSTSTQIAVVTVPSLNGYDINDYAARLGEKWGVGQKGKDNGIVLLIKPKIKQERGEVAISVGYGLEGVIPDVIASRVIRAEIIPAFQQENYYKGVDRAITVLMDLSKGEYTAEEYRKKSDSRGGVADVIFGFIILTILLSLVFRRRGGGGYSPGHTSGGGFFIFPTGGFGSSGSSGGFGGFSGGGGSFGGFGGGSFGGGGSSGSW